MTTPPGLFVTGTNTGVGKTFVTALIARELQAAGKRVGVYKPVASGVSPNPRADALDDATLLWRAAGEPGELSAVCPQRFAAPLAPHLAARNEGRIVDAKQLRTGLDYWSARSDIVLVEGAGGLLSPLTEDEYVADLALDLGFPLVIVAANAIGAINQTLQTVLTAKTYRGGIQVAGVVLNDATPPDADPSRLSNADELVRRCEVAFLGCLKWNATSLDRVVDWGSLSGGPR